MPSAKPAAVALWMSPMVEKSRKAEAISYAIYFPVSPFAQVFPQNKREVTTVIEIARQLIAAKQSFRIITPYDSQRSLLEGSLQDARLTWEDKCFNIDSFQGFNLLFSHYVCVADANQQAMKTTSLLSPSSDRRKSDFCRSKGA